MPLVAGPAGALQIWQKMTVDCAKTQQRILQEIIYQAKDTVIGKRLHFADIHSEVYKISRIIKDIERLEIFVMKQGWQESLFQEQISSSAPTTQIKLKALVDNRPAEAWRQ